MFPSKLYDSSFLRKCTSTDEITLLEEKNSQNKFQSLLSQDSKELHQQTYPLYQALSLGIFGTTQKYQFLLQQCQKHLQFLNDHDVQLCVLPFKLLPPKLYLLISLQDRLNDQVLLHVASLLF